jgi:glycosyltransferase involved in cell wall biosynthesis
VRVIHLAGYGGEYAGSFIPMLLAIGREAQARGWSVETVFQPDAEGRGWVSELRDAGILVSFAPAGGGRRDLGRWLAGRLDGGREPLLLHTHFTAFDLAAVSAARGRDGSAVIWHMHSPLERSAGQWVRNAVKFAVAGRETERLLAVAPDVERQLRARLAPRGKVEYFPNAIDCERFALATGEERASARERLGLTTDGPVLAHFGWDWERKAGDLFVATVAELRRRGIPALGATVGGGDHAAAAAERHGVPDAVMALAPTGAVGDVYAAADVFVSCSRAEGMPFAVLEAIARGTPVVATDLPGHAAVASRMAACRLAAATPAGLAAAVEESLARPAAERAESRAVMERELDVRPWARRLADLYERVAPRA